MKVTSLRFIEYHFLIPTLFLDISAESIMFFKIWANPGLFLSTFVLFALQFKFKLNKAKLRCRAWDSNPLSYGGRPQNRLLCRGFITMVF